jgi:hypothetical protein
MKSMECSAVNGSGVNDIFSDVLSAESGNGLILSETDAKLEELSKEVGKRRLKQLGLDLVCVRS